METKCFLENQEDAPEIKTSWKRWMVLGIFASYSLMSAFQWIQESLKLSICRLQPNLWLIFRSAIISEI